MPPPVALQIPKLTLRQLARLTPPEIRARATHTCSVRLRSVKVGLNDVGAYKMVQTTTLCVDRPHESTIQIFHEEHLPETLEEAAKLKKRVPKGPELWNRKAWVSCDCEFHLYTLEVALFKYGCTNILHSNGEFPSIRNPSAVPYLCKHLFSAAIVAINAGKEQRAKEFSNLTHPPHPGRPPAVLRHLYEKSRLTPTSEEIEKAIPLVRNFL